MNRSERAELRKLAEAATPGVWVCDQPSSYDLAYPADDCPCLWDDSGEYEYVGELADGGHVHLHHKIHRIFAGGEYVAGNYDYVDGGIVTRADRDYIIAAQPATVLTLLDELATAEQARRKAVDAHGQASVALAAVQATVARVRSIHCPMYEPDSGEATYCWECDERWPCSTIQALDGAE